MLNPLLSLRQLCELSQQDIAERTGTSQQFIARLESGATAHVAQSITQFFDKRVALPTRRSVLVDEYGDNLVLHGIKLETIEPTTTNLWRAYMFCSRLYLPDGLDLLSQSYQAKLTNGSTAKERRDNIDIARDFIQSLYEAITGSKITVVRGELSVPIGSQCLTVAQKIHCHPFVLERFSRQGGTEIPPSVIIALYKAGLGTW